VRQLATNSIPLLIEWLHRDDRPTLKGSFKQTVDRSIRFLEEHRVLKSRPHKVYMDWKSSYRSLALNVLSELGPDGKEAIPALIQMLGTKAPSTNDISPVAGAAYLILPRMAPASIPPLIEAASSTDLQVYALAAGALGDIGSKASAAIPVIRTRLNDQNLTARFAAADVLGKLGADPEVFMPTLVESLGNPDFTFLDYKLEILLKYKDHARGAVPVLLNLLTNAAQLGSPTNTYVLQQITSALSRIHPEAAKLE
jgi:HEAT repeat protein